MQTASPDVPHVRGSRAPRTAAASAEGRRRRPPPADTEPAPETASPRGFSCLVVVVVAVNTS